MSAGKLPEGWVEVELNDIAIDISYGYTASSSVVRVGPHMLRITDIQNNTVKWSNVPFCKIDDKQKEKYLLAKGDLVFARTGATVGKSFLIKGDIPESVYASYLIRVRCNEGINESYLSYFFRSPGYWNQITEFSSGIGQPNVNGTKLKKLILPIISNNEQEIIAEKIDTLLAQVDRTKARLEQIPKILKRFRQAVLAAAVNGKLLHCINEKSKFISLGSIAEDIRYGTSKKCSELEGSMAVLRIPNIGHGYVINKNLKYADFDSKEIKALTLSEGDLLLIRSNGSIDLVGKVAVISEADINYLYAGYLIRVRLDLDKAVPKYISYCLQSPQLRQVIENVARSTSGVNNINSKELASLELPLPLTPEQHEIVRRVEQLLSYADTIEKQVNNALARVNNLTQSILAKAFRGELTAQWRAENPELISGENSAAALLEKIKAERAASTGKKATRKKS